MFGLLIFMSIAAALVVLLLTATLAYQARRPPRHTAGYAIARGLACDPEEAGLASEEWTVRCAGGELLPVWDIELDGDNELTLVFVHGWGQSRIDMLARMEPFRQSASRAIMYDLRGHGEQAAATSRLGVNEDDDLMAVLERAIDPERDERFVLVGYSMGAVIALQAAARMDERLREKLAGVIAFGAYENFHRSLQGRLRVARYPVRPWTDLAMAWFRVHGLRHRSTNDAAKKVTVPILYLHGREDVVAPLEHAELLHDATARSELVVIDGGRHLDLHRVAPDQHDDAVRRFLHYSVRDMTTKTATKKTIEQVDVASKRVLMRVDFNVPLSEDGVVIDDRRIEQALPSIRNVIEREGRLILISHLGRPGGKGYEAEFSLAPVAERLREMLSGVNVAFVQEHCVGDEVERAVDRLGDGDVVLLDNLRFHSGEKSGDADFAEQLAELADIYCNNAFGTAHRNDASMYAVPKSMSGKPRVAGLLLQKELRFLSEAIEHAERPFVAVLGGAKVSDKLAAIENLLERVDTIIVGGAMAYTFLKAQGVDVGSSRVEEDRLDDAKRILQLAADSDAMLQLPIDHVCAQSIASDAAVEVHVGAIPNDWMGLDIGPETYTKYCDALRAAKTIVWNGPMGVFETPPFDVGTRRVAEAMVDATKSGATSIVGGGDSAAAVEQFGLADDFSHVSTGGGASLEMLEGKSFDSVELLDDA